MALRNQPLSAPQTFSREEGDNKRHELSSSWHVLKTELREPVTPQPPTDQVRARLTLPLESAALFFGAQASALLRNVTLHEGISLPITRYS